METLRLSIEGNKIEELVSLLKGEIGEYYIHPVEDVYIFISEKYYFRNNSDLMTNVVMNFSMEDRCEIQLVSGGGAEGLIGMDFGAENSRNKEIYKFIKGICEDRGWTCIKE